MIRRKTAAGIQKIHGRNRKSTPPHRYNTASDLARAFLEIVRNPNLESVMINKIVTIHSNNTILNAAKLIFKKRIGSVIVTADEHPFGIFTQRDLLNKAIGQSVDIEEMIG